MQSLENKILMLWGEEITNVIKDFVELVEKYPLLQEIIAKQIKKLKEQ